MLIKAPCSNTLHHYHELKAYRKRNRHLAPCRRQQRFNHPCHSVMCGRYFRGIWRIPPRGLGAAISLLICDCSSPEIQAPLKERIANACSHLKRLQNDHNSGTKIHRPFHRSPLSRTRQRKEPPQRFAQHPRHTADRSTLTASTQPNAANGICLMVREAMDEEAVTVSGEIVSQANETK